MKIFIVFTGEKIGESNDNFAHSTVHRQLFAQDAPKRKHSEYTAEKAIVLIITAKYHPE